MLIDLDFIPFSKEQYARWKNFQSQHDDLGPLAHPTRMATGLYLHLNNIPDQTVQRLVDDEVINDNDYRTEIGLVDGWGRKMVDDEYRHQRKMNRLYSQKYKRGPYRGLSPYTAYGVCDTPEQLLERFPHLVDDDVKRVISFSPIFREGQSDWGGFRYHKNGKYFGKQKPRSEYLYDDKHIDIVCCFHIYRVEP